MEAAGKRWIVHPSRSDEFKIWNLADLHWLSRACAEKDVREDIQKIRDDPFSFWIGGGDYCEFIGHTDRRFDPDCVAERVKVSDLGRLGMVGYREIRNLFKPIKRKCLGLLLGNHEKQYNLHMEQSDRQTWLCEDLGVPNLHYSALFDVVFIRDPKAKTPALTENGKGTGFTRESFRIFAHHGAGFAQTPGGKLNRLIQFMQSFEADIYFCGHVHDQVGRREPRMGANANCDHLEAKVRLGVISGSYLKTYAEGVTTYGEQRGYKPTVLGAAMVMVKPETREMRGEI